MFYARVFRTKAIFWQLFSSFKPKTQLCNFGAKILYEKRARKMLMKLTPGGLRKYVTRPRNVEKKTNIFNLKAMTSQMNNL